MITEGFEPSILGSELPQIHDLDISASGNDTELLPL
jgi:hypothetical protein